MPILVPLNTFKTLTHPVTADVISLPITPPATPPAPTLVYTTPVGVSTVVLLAQFTNYDLSTNETVSAVIYRGSAYSWLIRDLTIPAKDAGTFLSGRLVLEEGNRLYVRASTVAKVNFIFSYLETANA